MNVYFLTSAAPIGTVAYDIASARFPEHQWTKLILDTPDKQAQFEAGDDAPDLIISFLNPHVLPASRIEAVSGQAYNVHPSPPTNPGNDPQHFAVYEGRYVAGATLHQMDASVDSGPICDVVEVPVDPTEGLTRVRELSAHLSAALLFDNLDRMLDGKLAPDGSEWTLANKRSRADFLALCRIDPGISAEELGRRIGALYQPSYRNKPYVELHGFRFVYEPEPG